MGRKGKWLASVKKALSPHSKEKNELKLKKQLLDQRLPDLNSTSSENATACSPPPPLPPLPEEVKVIVTTNEEDIHTHSVPPAIAAAAEPAPTATIQTTAEVVQLARANKFAGKSKEEVAAINIQTAFRGYMARRALRALRGLVRLNSLMEGSTVKRQAVHTLRCMQTLARVQAQIHSRRMRMSEENQALQKQLLQKHAKELENLRIGEEWDDSLQSKEQIEANLLSKYEAAMRRERALAYSYSHQKTWKNSSRSANTMFMNPGNPAWGWSWLERWMAAHPWESRREKELGNNHSSVKSAIRGSLTGEISKSYARYQLNYDKLSPSTTNEKQNQPTSLQSPTTTSKPASSAVHRKLKSASPRSSLGGPDDDTRSMVSMQSYRRHSIAGSSVRDDESLGSCKAVPSYMVSTESARAKSRMQSTSSAEKDGTLEKEQGSLGSAKKRLSYPAASPAKPRRHSGPPKMESNLGAENSVIIGEGN